MAIFDTYTRLTALARGDILAPIKDVSAGSAASQTKSIQADQLLKYGPFSSTVRTVSATTNVTLADTDPLFVDITPTAARDVTCPAKGNDNHAYIVRNLSGTYTLTVKQSGGTTITTIAAGEVKLIIPSTINDFTTLTLSSTSGVLLAANNLSDLASAATARTNLGMSANGASLVTAANYAAMKTLLSLTVGTDVQAYHARLADLAGITYAQGDVLYFNGTNIVKLAAGTSGQFLKTMGAGANPTWATIAGGGDLLAANNLSDLASAATARTNLGMSANGASLVTAADYAAMRTLLSLTVGTNVQAYHARLADLAGITYAQGDTFYFNGTNIVKLAAGTSGQFLKTMGAGANPVWATIAGGGDLLAANNLSDLASAATARTNLGLAIGTNVQAYDAELAALAGLTSAADSFPYFTGSGTASLLSIVSAIRTLLASADVATFRSNAGLAIGTNVQAYDAELAALAGLTSAADKVPYFTGSGTAALADFSSFGRTLVDDADAAAARTTLGALGSAGGTLTGAVNLGENAGLELDAAGSADGKYSGIWIAGTAGATLAFGDLCYLSSVDSRWELVDANAEATAKGKLGMCILAAASDGSATAMLLIGNIRADAAFPALTVGAPVFASTTAGDIQTTAPSGAADIIRIVGHANTADELYFNPSNEYFEHA